jgi:hypothetical protein
VHAAPPEIDPIVNQFTRELPVTPLQIDLGARDLIDGDGIAEFSFTLNPVPTVNFCSIDHVAPAGTGTLSCDPQLNDGGNYTVTVTATDDSLEQESASTQFVLDVNTTPSINGILTQSVVEAGSIDITLDASDPDPGDGLTFSFAAAESFCSITFDNGNGLGTLTCSPALGDANSYTVTITATDDAAVQASASTSFTLTVGANQVPTADTVAITGTAVLGATLNGTYNYDDTEDDAEGTSTFKWYRNDVEIDGATGTSYTVVVEDVETTLTFGVTPVAQTGASPGTEEHSTGVLVANSTPILQDITDKSVVEGGTVNIALLASDPDGDVILFSHAISPPLPPSGDICAVTSENGAGAGTLTCAPSVGDEGTYLVTVTVTDNGDSPESTSDTFLLTVGPNQPPTAINVAVSGNATLGSTLTATYQYQDAELDPEGTSTFRWLRDGIEIPVAIGTSYTVVPDDVETNLRFEVTPVATVGATTGTPVQSADFPISNQPPVVANIANQSVGEAASLDIALSATDPEGDGLSFSFTSIPVQAQIFCSITADDGNGTGTLTCSPAVGDAALGPYTITVTATDDASSPASGSDAFTLTVEPNQPPTASNVGITGDPTVNSVLTGNYVYADTEDDLEGTSTFRWLRDGVPISGAVAQTYTVVIDDVETSLRFEVTPVAATGALTGTPVQSGDLLISNTAPSITGQVVIEIAEEGSREIVLADLIVTDLDSVFPDDFTLSVQDGANYTRSGVNGNIVTPALDFNGDLTVPVTVNDGFVDSSVFNLVVTVTPVNDAPVFISVVPPGLSTPEDTTLTIPVSALDISDPDNVPADFVLTLDPVLPPDANYILAGPASMRACDGE